MNIEERRAMIVRAALPLLVEIGPSVTTLQIARAAGISEPTIFRAFADKDEVLLACLDEATKPENVLIELEAIDKEAGLEERLTNLIDVIRLQGERTGAIMNAVRLAAPSKRRERSSLSDEEIRRLSESRTASHQRIHSAVCSVLEPDEARLRQPVTDIATIVIGIVMSLGRARRMAGDMGITTKQLEDLIMNGIVK
ncbi:TetR/AcrR family transcriptional regulator [Paenibacillus sepulcri]|uniref:TetR/AcrR family transcriptional regulator n=2 Tax=Paenibacillus sepulcri TaxID=359917 RepID=A0ABS7C6B6_9BACL|nr:TetR/AcrR family transcriptional regulator [Paenibacillus sepulcri]